MLQLEQNGFFTLTRENLDEYVPARAGVYMLAIRLANGVQQIAYSSQSSNLYQSLRSIAEGEKTISPIVAELLNRYQCYFSYFVIHETEYSKEIEKMLVHSSDPLNKLTVVNCN